MKNILTGCRMRKILFIAVCIRSSLWGGGVIPQRRVVIGWAETLAKSG